MKTTEIDDRIASNPLALAIQSVTLAMKSDFGLHYTKQFRTDDDMRMYKRRLYAKTRDLEPVDIVFGYESYIDAGKTFCPTIPELLTYVLSARKKRLSAAMEQEKAMQAASLPCPEHVRPQPERVNALMRDAMKTPQTDEAERLKRLAEKLQMHEALIAADKARGLIEKGPDWNSHSCAVGFCSNPGVLAHGKGGNFYCDTHFFNG